MLPVKKVENITQKLRLFSLWKFNSTYSTGSPKKHERQKTTWGLLTDISEKIKGHSINLKYGKIDCDPS